MKLTFIEAPAFSRWRETYLDDDGLARLQAALLANTHAGDVMQGTPGLRKLRWPDARRGKGKRGGLRIIYYHLAGDAQLWLFTLYAKDEVADLSPRDKMLLGRALVAELAARGRKP